MESANSHGQGKTQGSEGETRPLAPPPGREGEKPLLSNSWIRNPAEVCLGSQGLSWLLTLADAIKSLHPGTAGDLQAERMICKVSQRA